MNHLLNVFLLLLVFGCAHGVREEGGRVPLDWNEARALGPREIATYAQLSVKRSEKDLQEISLKDLRASPQGQLRRLAVVVFESEIQPSRSGLAAEENVYLSARAKQWLTRELYRQWLTSLSAAAPGLSWASEKELRSSRAFRSSGSVVEDLVLQKNFAFGDADVFWRQGGQRIPEETLMNPPDLQDLSLLLVPATHLMGGASPSQHQHQWVNELCRELQLDAVLVVYHGASWQRAGKDRSSGAEIPEVLRARVEATVLVPFAKWHAALEAKGKRPQQKLSAHLGFYQLEVQRPLDLAGSPKTFAGAQDAVILPLWDSFALLGDLVRARLVSDLQGN